MKKISLATMAFLLAIASASALEISPASHELVFKPGAVATFTFVAENTDNIAGVFEPYAAGQLSKYAAFEDEAITIKAGQKKPFTAVLLMPEKLESGVHSVGIGLKNTNTEVFSEARINLLVAYEGTYLKTQIEAPDAQVKKPNEITVRIENLGDKNTGLITPKVEIYDGKNNLLAALDAPTKEIKGNDLEFFSVFWSGPSSGTYTAKAITELNSQASTASGSFILTRTSIYFTSIIAPDINIDKKQTFDIELTNEGESAVEGTLKAIIRHNGETIATLPDTKISISPRLTKTTVLNWYAKGQPIGDYEIIARFNYGSFSTSFSKSFRITDPRNPFIAGSSPGVVVVVALMFALIIQYTGFGARRKP